MATEPAIAIVLTLFLVCLLLEVQVGLALALAGGVGIALTRSVDVSLSVLASMPYGSTSSYALFTIPMFIMLGAMVAHTGIGLQIFNAISYFVRGIPGGLAATTAVAIGMFSGISGASSADVATFGRLSVDQMTRHGYDEHYASSVVVSAATFAILIPPSIILLIYAIIAEQSPGEMLLAGLVPGVLSALTLAIFVVVRARLTRRAGFGGREKESSREAVGGREVATARGDVVTTDARHHPMTNGDTSVRTEAVPTLVRDDSSARADAAEGDASPAADRSPRGNFIGVICAIVLFTVVLGGMYTGIFTATEAGAWGALAALLIVLTGLVCPKDQRRKVITTGLRETANVTSMIFLLLIGGAVFGFFAASVGLPRLVAEWAAGLDIPPALLVILFLAIILLMGTLLDSLSILLLAGPVLLPVVEGLGYDLVWFGILMLKVIEVGLITPPVGMNVFIISGILKQRPERVFAFVWPFVALDLAITALLFVFPSISLWLPSQMAG